MKKFHEKYNKQNQKILFFENMSMQKDKINNK